MYNWIHIASSASVLKLRLQLQLAAHHSRALLYEYSSLLPALQLLLRPLDRARGRRQHTMLALGGDRYLNSRAQKPLQKNDNGVNDLGLHGYEMACQYRPWDTCRRKEELSVAPGCSRPL